MIINFLNLKKKTPKINIGSFQYVHIKICSLIINFKRFVNYFVDIDSTTVFFFNLDYQGGLYSAAKMKFVNKEFDHRSIFMISSFIVMTVFNNYTIHMCLFICIL